MAKSISLLIVATCLVVAACEAKRILNSVRYDIKDIEGPQLKDAYAQLSAELEKRVANDDPQANLAAAMQMFQEALESGHTESEPEMQALRLFQNLNLINVKTMCTFKSYNILWNNKHAANVVQVGEIPQSRIGKIVYLYLDQHASACPFRYVERLERRLRGPLRHAELEITKQLYDRVKDFWINRSGMPKEDETGPMRGDYYLGGNNYLKTIVMSQPSVLNEHVLASSGNQLSQQDENQMMEAYERYLIQPCGYIYIHFYDIFDPASFDELFGDGVNKDDKFWYRAMNCYEMCKHIAKNEESVLENARQYLESATNDIAQ